MSLLLALLLAPAWAADLPKDPIEQSMVMGAEELQGTQALQAGQDILGKMHDIRERYAQDGDLERYARDRDRLLPELHAAWQRQLESREAIKRTQTTQQMFNIMNMAASIRYKKGRADSGVAGPRLVEIGRVMDLVRNLGETQGKIYFAINEEAAFFAAEQERARTRRRLALAAAAAFLALAAAGAVFVRRLLRKA